MEQQWFEYLLGLLSLISPLAQILIVIFISPLLFIIYKAVRNRDFRMDLFNLIKVFKRETIYNTRNHEIFLSKTIYNNYITNIHFPTKLKNDIFQTILQIKINTTIAKLKECIKPELEDIDNIEIKMDSLITDIIDTYETDIKMVLSKKYKEDSDFLYQLIYIDNFKLYHSVNITYILKAIKSFSKSRLSNNQKMYIFLNFIYISLDQAIMECERVFDDLNGDLDKYNEKWYGKK